MKHAHALALAAIALVWAWGPSPVVRADDLALKASGYAKNLATLTDVGELYRDYRIADQSLLLDDYARARARLSVAMGPDADLVMHYEAALRFGDTLAAETQARRLYSGNPFTAPIVEAFFPHTETPRLFGLTARESGDDWSVTHGPDRLFFRLLADRWTFTVGRTAVSWGPGYFFTPTDYFAPFSPTEIDKEEKPGIDLARVQWNRGRFALDALAAPVRRDDGVDDVDVATSAAAFRLGVNAWEIDAAISGGWLYDRFRWGLDATRPVGGALVRVAGVVTRFRDEPHVVERDPKALASAGVDYAFHARWNPAITIEALWNDAGTADPERYAEWAARPESLAAASRGEVVYSGRHYAAAGLSLQPHPLVSLSETALVNIGDGSAFWGSTITWNALTDLDVQAAARLTLGSIPSEFGGFTDALSDKDYRTPDVYYLYLKFYR